MKIIKITGHLCIFDSDADTSDLSVSTQPNGYKILLYTCGVHKTKRYSRVLLKATALHQVDHINGNSLDNRLCNLRLATASQNSFNKTGHSKLQLPKGVEKHGTGYRARIHYKYSKYNLGTYSTIKEASDSYDAAAIKYFGEFAKLNNYQGETE